MMTQYSEELLGLCTAQSVDSNTENTQTMMKISTYTISKINAYATATQFIYNMVKYKDTYLAKGSEALKLYEAKDFKKLDKHLKELDKNLKELMERY